ncbi:MAG: DUF115 domain-containing protein, partial [Deltaproteobacteria bacterium]|nr:DUF115 domain-containing protein [Deltaproteobacteria bacterium]
RPAIVIGAGPSLNKNIRFLKEAFHKALLVSVDAALKPLLEAGIKPHITTNIERTKGQDAFFSNLNNLEDTFFVFCPLVPPLTYDAYKGPKIIAHRYEGIMEWIESEKGVLGGGPLVGNFTFSIARYLGCNPIILVGQDLSFKTTGSTHVKGMVFGNRENYRKNMSEVEGNYGEILMTNRTFAEAKASLEIQIDNFDGLCINATEGGARIKGTVFLDLKNSLKKYCTGTHDYLNILKRHWHQVKPSPMDIAAENQRVLSIMDRTLSDLDNVVTGCKKGLDVIESFENNHELIKEGEPNTAVFDPLKPVQNELYHLREKIIATPSFMYLWYIFQSFHTSFEMKRNFLFDQFHSHHFAKLGTFLILRDWFCMMGQLALSTIHTIKRTTSRLNKTQ